MRAISSLAVAALLLAAPPTAAGPNGSIHIYRMSIAPDLSVGAAVIPSCGTYTTTFAGIVSKAAFGVFAELGGPTAGGISSAEFYISGLEAAGDLPAGWTKSITFPAGAMVDGNFHDVSFDGQATVRRGNIFWEVSAPNDATCQTGPLVLLATVVMQSPFGNPYFPQDHRLELRGGSPPSNPQLPCPVLRLCDFPVFTGVCVTGNDFILNPPWPSEIGDSGEVGDPYPADGATGVPRQTELRWTWVPGDDCTVTEWMAILHFGTDPDHLGINHDPPSCGVDRKCYSPPLLEPYTTYYWRASGGYVTSPLWRFTTGDVIGVDRETWGRVKALFR